MRRILFYLSLLFSIVSYGQQPNIAPAATVSANGTGAAGCQTGPCSTLNDLNLGTCGTQQMWISTSNPPSTTVGDDYIEWNWPTPQAFDEMTIHHASATTRSLTGFLMQYWNGVSWVNGESFTNLPQQCINTVSFQRIVASRMRITLFEMTGSGQTSNPNFREIEIFQASTSSDDAGVVSTNPVPAVCPGSYPVEVTIQNFGINRIDSVQIFWEMNGVAQPTFNYTTQLDTIGGTGNSNAVVNLGNYTFTAGITYNLRAWTALPNGNADTVNFNDTLQLPVALGAPTGLAVSNLTSTTADVSWTSIAGTSYGIIYGPRGFNPNTSGTTVLPATTPRAITGLTPTTLYDVYLFADCGSSVYSDTAGPVGFATKIAGPRGVNCDTASSTVVLLEEFDTQGGWTGDIGTSTGQWNYNSGTTGSSNTGPNGAYSGSNYIYFEASGAGPASMVTPAIDLTTATDSAELSFWMHAYGADIGYLLIRAGTTSATGPFNDTIFFYDQGQLQTASSDPWQQVGVRLDQYVGNTLWLEFEADRTTSFSGDISLDLLQVEACGDFCFPPFSVDSIIPSVFSSTIYVDTSSNTYVYEWGPCGFTQGTGATAVGTNQINLTGLSPNTCYDVYIRTDCGGSLSLPRKYSFRTNCLYIAPFIEDFETYTAGQAGPAITGCLFGNNTSAPRWETEDASGANENSLNTGPHYDNTLFPNSGGMYLYLETSGGGLNDSDWFETPIIDISALTRPYVSFAYHMYGADMGNLKVQYTDGGAWQTLGQLTGQQQTAGSDPWLTFGDSLGVLNSDSIRLRFIGYRGNGFTSDMSVDDIEVKDAPLCIGSTFLSVTTDSTTSSSGFVTWNGGAGSTYEVVWGPTGFLPSTGGLGTASVVDTFYSIGGLIPQTTYDVYVRDSCAAGYSTFLGPITFTTLCTGVSMPYYESFDTWPLACWDMSAGSQDWVEYVGATDSYAEAEFWTYNGDSMVMSTRPITITQDAQVRFYWSHEYMSAYPDDELIVRAKVVGGQWDTLLTLKGPNFHDPGAGANTPGGFIKEELLLDPNTYTGNNAIIELRANSDWGPDLFVNDFYVENAPTCPSLSNLDTNNVTDTSATLTWSSTSSSTQYQVWYGPVGFFQGSGTAGAAQIWTSNNSLTLNGLPPQTCYEYVVRSYCTPGDTSGWEGPFIFCTACPSVFPLPYNTGFENITIGNQAEWENCWSTNNTSGLRWESEDATGANENSLNTGPFYDATMPTVAGGTYMYIETSTSGTSAELVSPVIDISQANRPELHYYYHMYGATIDHLDVYAQDANNQRILIDSIIGQQQTAGSDSFALRVVNLSSLPAGDYRFVFEAFRGSSFTGDVSIDEVSVMDGSACAQPSALTMTNKGCDSVEVTWTSASGSSIIEYGPAGFPAGQGTVTAVVTSPYTISGLMPGVAYDFRVADTCGADTSAYTSSLVVTTDTAPKPVANIQVVADSTTGGVKYFGLDASGSANATSYSWDFGNGNSAVGAQAVASYTTNGAVTIYLTATNGCGSHTDSITVNVNIGLVENELSSSLAVFPNPATDEVKVSFSVPGMNDIKIRVLDLSGKEVMSRTEHTATDNYRGVIRIDHLADGVYMLEISSGDLIANKRLIKQ